MDIIKFDEVDLHSFGNEIQIEGTLWGGKGLYFITLVPQKELNINASDIKLMPLTLEEWQKLLKQSDLLETEILQEDSTGVTKAIYRKSQRQIDSYLQWACFKRDNYRCRYCYREVPLTVDHVVLFEEFGPTIELNLLSSCKSCNKDRGRMQYSDWLNSDLYKRKSQNLPLEIKVANSQKLNDIPQIKTMLVKNIRSR